MALASFRRAAALALILLVSTPSLAQEKTGKKEGFVLRPGTVRIMVMRPTIQVGAQSTGGLYEPNADWTQQARDNLAGALAEAQSKLGNQVIGYAEGTTGEGPLVTQYAHLFSAVADSVIEYQFFVGNRLETKKRSGAFEWGVGDGIARLKSLEGADYALFITTHDEYGSTGRKVLQVVGALGGVGVTSGVHIGHAGLIDLRTGELVWLNADRQMGGDVRTPEGAAKRVRELLAGFPGKPVDLASTGTP
ncbi:hypothetical protein [Sphingomonas oligoaromativorans]|uniref:hypothetical protein n=1 Tax=Sphingomonas oligoaromativorans TaxID=575322 RepID=UPI001422BC67|nr:hypothetical protein [Sphingomonas oligoaromativorans]NIJ34218.1 hypothetical protein [Sphingomonas oligoaromativorans]